MWECYIVCRLFYFVLCIAHCNTHSCISEHWHIIYAVTDADNFFPVYIEITHKFLNCNSLVNILWKKFNKVRVWTEHINLVTKHLSHMFFNIFHAVRLTAEHYLVKSKVYDFDKIICLPDSNITSPRISVYISRHTICSDKFFFGIIINSYWNLCLNCFFIYRF